MRQIEAEARAASGATEIRLDVFSSNGSAVRLDERSGYAATSQVMRRPLA
ncbi:hypothetical protein [Geodermatophilus sp. DF01-2]|nr:hypothetical protein [Geodermatophilus sp. DF01_2]